MQVLIVGGGGREHAMAWKCAQSSHVDHVFVAPGNAGCITESNVSNVPIAADKINQLLAFAQDRSIDLTIVGPEVPLVAGITDQFQAAGLRIFGPTAQASQLEGSKSFAKDFLQRHAIPTASFKVFEDVPSAADYIEATGVPIVIKADGLAAGKGVVVATTVKQALSAVHEMLAGNAFGEAGHRVVIEEFLSGEEASFICLVDGSTALPMASSQDHKARDDGDKGPNTGGMGAYSPAPVITPEVHEHIMQDIINPVVAAMSAEGNTFTGFLYAGLMIDEYGRANVIEFNTRLGDPETQPLMMRLDSDLIELCIAALDGKLESVAINWKPQPAVGVVMAAGGYPGDYATGSVINGLEQANHDLCKVFHAGTAINDRHVVTSGGRVLCVTALGASIIEAQQTAYDGVAKIHWENSFYRRDIAYRAIAQETS